jgi:hypothetical protein
MKRAMKNRRRDLALALQQHPLLNSEAVEGKMRIKMLKKKRKILKINDKHLLPPAQTPMPHLHHHLPLIYPLALPNPIFSQGPLLPLPHPTVVWG